MRIKRILLWILVLGIMTVIFCFSGQSGDESHESSLVLTEPLLQAWENMFDRIDPSIRQQVSDDVENTIRKLAHFSEYAVLGIALLLLLRDYRVVRQRSLAWLITTLYAGTDELHQLLAQAGRSGQLTDVLIDSAGALVGITFLYLILKRRNVTKM